MFYLLLFQNRTQGLLELLSIPKITFRHDRPCVHGRQRRENAPTLLTAYEKLPAAFMTNSSKKPAPYSPPPSPSRWHYLTAPPALTMPFEDVAVSSSAVGLPLMLQLFSKLMPHSLLAKQCSYPWLPFIPSHPYLALPYPLIVFHDRSSSLSRMSAAIFTVWTL